MSKEKSASVSIVQELLQPGVYKRNQGRVARQVTFAAIATLVALGSWRLSQYWIGEEALYRYAIPGGLLLVGLWISYRVVNLSNFADFLIAVEGEMAKVSWPRRTELFRSSIVVIVTIVFLAAILFGYDLVWNSLLKALGVLKPGDS
jgi:preprotein translocase subunit SecE